jgi:hypothetical protein
MIQGSRPGLVFWRAKIAERIEPRASLSKHDVYNTIVPSSGCKSLPSPLSLLRAATQIWDYSYGTAFHCTGLHWYNIKGDYTGKACMPLSLETKSTNSTLGTPRPQRSRCDATSSSLELFWWPRDDLEMPSPRQPAPLRNGNRRRFLRFDFASRVFTTAKKRKYRPIVYPLLRLLVWKWYKVPPNAEPWVTMQSDSMTGEQFN